MRLKQYQVDAFTSTVFSGNPAAVVPLSAWPEDPLLQAIAEENNLSETAFCVPSDTGYALRWFTPVAEVDLCGHATLATAHVLFTILGHAEESITFTTRSGVLSVRRRGEALEMDFPATESKRQGGSELLAQGLGVRPLELFAAEDYLAVFDSEAMVRAITPDHGLLAQLDLRGVIVTAPGREVDFVSRFFAPKYGIAEDPVTGSAHCALAPFWGKRLGKTRLSARQVSKRGGDLFCEITGDRVLLLGRAVTFMEAEIVV